MYSFVRSLVIGWAAVNTSSVIVMTIFQGFRHFLASHQWAGFRHQYCYYWSLASSLLAATIPFTNNVIGCHCHWLAHHCHIVCRLPRCIFIDYCHWGFFVYYQYHFKFPSIPMLSSSSPKCVTIIISSRSSFQFITSSTMSISLITVSHRPPARLSAGLLASSSYQLINARHQHTSLSRVTNHHSSPSSPLIHAY